MKICVVTESASAKANPHRKMERSDLLCLDDDKMIQAKQKTKASNIDKCVGCK